MKTGTVSSTAQPVLRNHHLGHIPELRVQERLVTAKFSPGCSMMNCDATCCTYGVYADIQERDNIMAHVSMIQQYMEPHQVKDPSLWFEDHEVVDEDFPSGRAIGTREMDYGCVFLDSGGRCTLQKAATAEGMHPFSLKPFYCVAYPIAIEHGELMLDEPDFADRPRCCRPTSGGTQDIVDVCGDELKHVLGAAGMEELLPMIGRSRGKTSCPE